MALNHPNMKFILNTEKGTDIHIDYSASTEEQARIMIFSDMTGLETNSFIHRSINTIENTKIIGILTKLNSW